MRNGYPSAVRSRARPVSEATMAGFRSLVENVRHGGRAASRIPQVAGEVVSRVPAPARRLAGFAITMHPAVRFALLVHELAPVVRDLVQWSPGGEEQWSDGVWTECNSCNRPGPPLAQTSDALGGCWTSCTGGHSGGQLYPAPVPANHRRLMLWEHSASPFFLYRLWKAYVREPGEVAMPPGVVPGVPSWIAPVEAPPALEPLELPVLQPARPPARLPWRVLPHRRPNWWRSPVEQSIRGHAPRPRFRPRLAWAVSPASAGWARMPMRPRPPRAGERERKIRMRVHLGAFEFAFSQFGEFEQWVDAMWYTLPQECRLEQNQFRAGLMGRAMDVYRCLDQVDGEALLFNIIMMMGTDHLFGMIGQGLISAEQTRFAEGWHSTAGRTVQFGSFVRDIRNITWAKLPALPQPSFEGWQPPTHAW